MLSLFGLRPARQVVKEEPLWLDDMTHIPREERVRIDLEVSARVQGSRRKLVLRDLTTQGARIEALEGLRYDDILSLTLPGLKPKPAYVVWVKDGSAGIAFERPLHPEIFSTLVKKHGAVARVGEGKAGDAGAAGVVGLAA